MDPNSTDALFEIIRKELNTIIENGEKKQNPTENIKQSKAIKDPKKVYGFKGAIQNPESVTTGVKPKQEELPNQNIKNVKNASVGKDKGKPNQVKDNTPSPSTPLTGAKAKEKIPTKQKTKNDVTTLKEEGKTDRTKENNSNKTKPSTSTGAKVKKEELEEQETNPLPRLRAGLKLDRDTLKKNRPDMSKLSLENEIASQAEYLNSPRTKNLDADIQKMQMELQESYVAFQSISEKFESISFHNLQRRIKDLNLSRKSEMLGQPRSDELKRVVEEGFKDNRLSEYTSKVGEKFSKHTGEFGDIPELSSFFQACTQLEQVLGNLKHHRNEVVNLEERMRRSAEISINRASLIKKQLEEKRFERPARMESKEDIKDDDTESLN